MIRGLAISSNKPPLSLTLKVSCTTSLKTHQLQHRASSSYQGHVLYVAALRVGPAGSVITKGKDICNLKTCHCRCIDSNILCSVYFCALTLQIRKARKPNAKVASLMWHAWKIRIECRWQWTGNKKWNKPFMVPIKNLMLEEVGGATNRMWI